MRYVQVDLMPLNDLRGQNDQHGYLMHATIIAVADELASAAELAMGKLAACPAALIRGYQYEPVEGTAQELALIPIRPSRRYAGCT